MLKKMFRLKYQRELKELDKYNTLKLSLLTFQHGDSCCDTKNPQMMKTFIFIFEHCLENKNAFFRFTEDICFHFKMNKAYKKVLDDLVKFGAIKHIEDDLYYLTGLQGELTVLNKGWLKETVITPLGKIIYSLEKLIHSQNNVLFRKLSSKIEEYKRKRFEF